MVKSKSRRMKWRLVFAISSRAGELTIPHPSVGIVETIARPNVTEFQTASAHKSLINFWQAKPETRITLLVVLRSFSAHRVSCLQVQRMTRVYCNVDPAWALDVLQSAALTLEHLKVVNPREQHLQAVHTMPGLRRLDIECVDGALLTQPPALPALPQGSLQRLRVVGLPRTTLLSLLRAHAATLDVLWLCVGIPGGGPWPLGCDDLDALLSQCGLCVSRVVLLRPRRDSYACATQVAAVRRVLPCATVQCNACDGVPNEDF